MSMYDFQDQVINTVTFSMFSQTTNWENQLAYPKSIQIVLEGSSQKNAPGAFFQHLHGLAILKEGH